MHDYLDRLPFDIYELRLFQEVAKVKSFTKAASKIGLSQSALTRKIQGMEGKLDVALFERTTRSVRLTDAGSFLYEQSDAILHQVNATLIRLREKFELAPKSVRVGVSKTLSMSYLPGFFSSYRRRFSDTRILASQHESADIILRLENSELDIGIISAPRRMPSALRLMGSFDDRFSFIVPAGSGEISDFDSLKAFVAESELPWLEISRDSNTARNLEKWLSKKSIIVDAGIELDSFDLIASFVSLNIGYSCVPTRSLALYNRTRKIQKLRLGGMFSRKIVFLASKSMVLEEHVERFVDSIPFS